METDTHMIEVKVAPEQGETAYTIGRYGVNPIAAVRLVVYSGMVDIELVGVRGLPLVGGAQCLPLETMDELARRWLASRQIITEAMTEAQKE